MVEIRVYVMVVFNTNSGEVTLAASGISQALMKLYAMQELKKHQGMFIIDRETGQVVWAYDGRLGRAFTPKTYKHCADFGIALNDLQFDERFAECSAN